VYTLTYLFIINHQPYGSDLSFNGLRLAMTLQKEIGAHVDIFLMGDAAPAAMKNQETLNGSYNIERMLKVLSANGSNILVCGSCMDYRGMSEENLMAHATRSTMTELALLTEKADKVLTF